MLLPDSKSIEFRTYQGTFGIQDFDASKQFMHVVLLFYMTILRDISGSVTILIPLHDTVDNVGD